MVERLEMLMLLAMLIMSSSLRKVWMDIIIDNLPYVITKLMMTSLGGIFHLSKYGIDSEKQSIFIVRAEVTFLWRVDCDW